MTNQLLFTAIKASVEAGQAIMDIYNTDFDVENKDDNSPLTKADKNANNIINKHLRPTEIPIISEENEQTPYKTRKDWNQCWIVDPLDGTKEFVKRNGEFTVNIALSKDGDLELGVIYVPVTKTLYFSENSSKTASKLSLETHQISESDLEKAIALNPMQNTRNTDKIRLVGSRSHMNADTKAYIKTLESGNKTVDVIAAGSSLKFCLVAEGKADVYPRFAPTMEWDTAAGQSICEAVGINVTVKDSDKALHYNKESLLNPYFSCNLLEK